LLATPGALRDRLAGAGRTLPARAAPGRHRGHCRARRAGPGRAVCDRRPRGARRLSARPFDLDDAPEAAREIPNSRNTISPSPNAMSPTPNTTTPRHPELDAAIAALPLAPILRGL